MSSAGGRGKAKSAGFFSEMLLSRYMDPLYAEAWRLAIAC
jgi:hypothetical protein